MKISLKETAECLGKAQRIAITAHVNPDGDALGSSLGLMHALRTLGKGTQVLVDDDLPACFSVLPGFHLIRRPEDKNDEVDLLVVLDASLDRIGSVGEKTKAKKVLNIDHHVTNDQKADFLFLDAKSAATAEIVYHLLGEMAVPLTEDIAICLYTGLATDTGFFRFANTSPTTMRAAAHLLEYGVRPNIIAEAMGQKPYATVMGMAKAMQTIEVLCGGKAAGLFIDKELAQTLETTEGFIDFARMIEGVEVAVLLKWKEENVCRASLRSKNLDVAKIALAFGGGGHTRAAGCTLNLPFAEAKKAILEAVRKAVEHGRDGGK